MDLLDVFFALPADPPTGRGRSRTAEERLSGGVGMGLMPVVCLCVVLFTGLWEHPAIAVGALPALAAMGAAFLARALGTRIRWVVVCGLGSFATCFMASGMAFLLALFASFFTMF